MTSFGAEDAALRQVSDDIRSRLRSEAYWTGAERAVDLWLGPLRLDTPIARIATIDFGVVLDELYEREVSSDGLAARLHELTDLGRARAYLDRVQPDDFDSLWAAEFLTATIAVDGTKSFEHRCSPPVADSWLRSWTSALWRHNVQQQRTAAVARGDAPLPRSAGSPATFGGGVEDFVAAFADTGAGPLAFTGVLPFAGMVAPVELEGLVDLFASEPSFLDAMARLLRLGQDAKFDATEPLNAGVAGVVREQGCGIAEARQLAVLAPAEVEARLWESWARLRADVVHLLIERVNSREGRPEAPLLEELTTRVVQLVDGMVEGQMGPRALSNG